ncbi:hypothetical protein VaNZ11_006827, partial [Volvox africanus]
GTLVRWTGQRGICAAPKSCTARFSSFGSSSSWRSSSSYQQASSAASDRGGGLHDPWKLQQLQSQVFELKQRLVEAEVQRQAADKVAAEAQLVRQKLKRTLTQ